MYPRFKLNHLVLALMACSPGAALAETELLAAPASDNVLQLDDTHVVATAAQELKQAPGASIITAEDIKKRPPVNDLSDIIRKMPGVNLSGNSAAVHAAITARSTCAAWARRTP